MRKIPDGAEVVNIMVGEVDFLKKRISAFIRLKEPRDLGNLSEVTLPTRFVYILIGPKSIFNVMSETGRSVGTMMVDEVRLVKNHLLHKIELCFKLLFSALNAYCSHSGGV